MCQGENIGVVKGCLSIIRYNDEHDVLVRTYGSAVSCRAVASERPSPVRSPRESFLSEVAKSMGVQAWLIKNYTSAEELFTAIQQAVTSIKSIQ